MLYKALSSATMIIIFMGFLLLSLNIDSSIPSSLNKTIEEPKLSKQLVNKESNFTVGNRTENNSTIRSQKD